MRPQLSPDQIQAALPKNGLFSGKSWLWSPSPFEISSKQANQLEALGHPLACFQRACDEIYRRSAKGSLPEWIAELIDIGKPTWMAEHQKQTHQARTTPRVIRPDLILTEEGFSLTELDSVPGGIGLTAWMNRVYLDAGFDSIIGKEDAMLEGFRSLLPEGGKVLVSEESADYRPEMEWLCGALNKSGQSNRWETTAAESYLPESEEALYRFFELFDWEQIPAVRELLTHPKITPPIKPLFEEKLWLALFWTPGMQAIWKQALRSNRIERLAEVIPYGWVMDPSPLPPHAALPNLDLPSWQEVGELSQKQRQLVLKISGFNERAWGGRGVLIGHDLPAQEWKNSIQESLNSYEEQPWIMQRFMEGKLIEHPYYDPSTNELKMMKGRARLCPYYFLDEKGKAQLSGCLATIVPADKKKIHGMTDGILVPVSVAPEED